MSILSTRLHYMLEVGAISPTALFLYSQPPRELIHILTINNVISCHHEHGEKVTNHSYIRTSNN